MKKILTFSVFLATFAVAPVMAQHHGSAHGNGHHSASAGHSAYQSMQSREIKALSAQQIEGLRGGRGMGMAMPAELNGYPGPLHVLELASTLGLTSEQLEAAKELYTEMLEAAKAQGEKVIEAERELDTLFAQKKATAESVSSAVSAAAVAQGRLRETHLRYHLEMMNVLTPEQIDTCNKLRRY